MEHTCSWIPFVTPSGRDIAKLVCRGCNTSREPSLWERRCFATGFMAGVQANWLMQDDAATEAR